MEKEFVPYELAVKLKVLGFDEPCFKYKDGTNFRPLYQQAFRWFREKYKIGTWIHHYYDMDKGNFTYSWVITLPYKDDGYVYNTYEEAERACLDKLLEIVEFKSE